MIGQTPVVRPPQYACRERCTESADDIRFACYAMHDSHARTDAPCRSCQTLAPAARVAVRPVVLFLLPVRRLHGRRVLLHVLCFVAAAVRRRLARRRLLLVLPALAPQHIVEARDEEDAADNAAPIQIQRRVVGDIAVADS